MDGCEVGKYTGKSDSYHLLGFSSFFVPQFLHPRYRFPGLPKKCPVLKKVCLSRQKHVCVERLRKQKIANSHIFLYLATIVFNQLEL